MKRELDEALVRDFPLLFGDRHGDMRKTCMCWGFPGDGWEPILREAASKLEPMIQKFIDDNPDLRCVCGCPKSVHATNTANKLCTNIFHLPLVGRYPHHAYFCYITPKHWWQRIWKRFTVKLTQKFNRLFWWLADKNILYKAELCKCTGYYPDHPKAMQVKEKFGTMRFYMSACTEEMNAVADECENKSCTICEDCGKPGVLRDDLGWILTLCDTCYKERLDKYPRLADEIDEDKTPVPTGDAVGGDEGRNTQGS